MLSLRCPACGGPLGAADEEGKSQCSYCGTKVVITEFGRTKEIGNLAHYHELCEVAKQAKNYQDLLKYSNMILEIDSQDSKGWINKALATARLSTDENERFDEAEGYIERASRNPSASALVDETRAELKQYKIEWYLQQAREYNIRAANALRAGLNNPGNEYVIRAATYYLFSLRIQPNDIVVLERLKLTTDGGTMVGIQWSDEVKDRLRTLEKWKAKESAINKLPGLQQKMSELQEELSKQSQKKGFFARLDREDIQDEIKQLGLEIDRLRQAANYEIGN